jgi:hypothetical protein
MTAAALFVRIRDFCDSTCAESLPSVALFQGGKKKKKSKTLTNKLVGDGLGETKIGADTDASETGRFRV